MPGWLASSKVAGVWLAGWLASSLKGRADFFGVPVSSTLLTFLAGRFLWCVGVFYGAQAGFGMRCDEWFIVAWLSTADPGATDHDARAARPALRHLVRCLLEYVTRFFALG